MYKDIGGIKIRLTMRLTKKLVNIWILLVVSTFPSSSSGKAITCTAGDFTAGTNASFVCYFPDDIDNHQSVYIQRYPLNAPTDASGFQVLLCKVSEVKASTCKGKDGYVFKGYTRNTISVEVVSVTEEEAGRYMCQFVPPSQSPTDMCHLTVHGAVTSSNLDDHHSSTSVEKQVATTIPQTGETGTVSMEVFVPVITVFAIAIAVAFIFVIIMYRRHQRPKESSSEPTGTGTREQAQRGSVNSPAAELNDPGVPLLECEKQDTSSTSLAARPDDSTIQPPPPPDETSTSRANRNTQNVSTLRPPHSPDTSFTPFTTGITVPPPVQDDNEKERRVYLTDTEQLIEGACARTIKKSEFVSESDNKSYSFEKNNIQTDIDTKYLGLLLTRMHEELEMVKRKVEDVEVKRKRASYVGTLNDSQPSKDILKQLLRKLRETGVRLQRQVESGTEPDNVRPIISCVEQILDHVERGQVDEQTHEAICKIPAEFKEVSCKIS